MTILLAALLLASQPTSPPAAEIPEVKSSYRAHRSPTCADWRGVRTGRGALPVIEAAYNNWFHGYATGFNAHGPDPTGDLLGTTTWTQVGAFIDDHCTQNPSRLVVDALEPLVADLMDRRSIVDPVPPPIRRSRGEREATNTVPTTCADWNGAREDRILRVVFGGAVRGYLTAYNRWGPDPTGDVLLEGNDALIDGWFDRWCSERPSAFVMEGVPLFIRHLDAERAAGRLAAGRTPAIEQVIPIAGERLGGSRRGGPDGRP